LLILYSVLLRVSVKALWGNKSLEIRKKWPPSSTSFFPGFPKALLLVPLYGSSLARMAKVSGVT
jgi:hypothetical protein